MQTNEQGNKHRHLWQLLHLPLGVLSPRSLNVMLCLIALTQAGTALASYKRAQAAFSAKQYEKAAGLFFQSYSYPKDSAMERKAEWGLAQSLQKVGFFYSSSKYYSTIVRRGSNRRNPFFRKALEELGEINENISLGQSHIVQLFKVKVPSASIPGPARGFYFYFLGIESFNNEEYRKAVRFFKRVPASSGYYPRALFYLGVASTLRGQKGKAVGFFEQVRSIAIRRGDQSLLEQANLSIARVYYESKKLRRSLRYYAEIPRSSESWLQALFEASWTFFLMAKHNNVLGNIHTLHSPYFDNRFFPESYILRAITFLRLCRSKQSRDSLTSFKSRYTPVYADVKSILKRFRGNPKRMFKLVYDYQVGSLRKYRRAWSILDSLSRTDTYKEARVTVRFADRELARLSRMGRRWASVGLLDELKEFLSKKKSAAVIDSGRRLFRLAATTQGYLKDLSEQSRLINLEIKLQRVDELRKKLNVGTVKRKTEFIGGLQPLRIGQDLEYWPFEGEYWEDELGGYVYNLDSKCRSGGKE